MVGAPEAVVAESPEVPRAAFAAGHAGEEEAGPEVVGRRTQGQSCGVAFRTFDRAKASDERQVLCLVSHKMHVLKRSEADKYVYTVNRRLFVDASS